MFAGEGFSAGDDDEPDAQLVPLADDVADLVIREFFFRRRPDGFLVAARAVEVAFMRDTEDDDRWDVGALCLVIFPSLGRVSLPADGFEEEQGLGWMPEADFDGVGEEDAQGVVESESEVVGRHTVPGGRIMTVS